MKKSLKFATILRSSCTILLLFLLSGCGRYYVEVYRQRINASYLASKSLGTPDPKLKKPPLGEVLVIEWQIPIDLLQDNPFIQLDVIFWDDTQERYVFPVNHRKGFERFFVLDDDYIKTGGILTYRVRLMKENGEIYQEWRQQLWVNLITIDNSKPPLPRSKGALRPNPNKDQ